MRGISSLALLLQAACALAAPAPAPAPAFGPAAVEVLSTRRLVEPRGNDTTLKSCNSAKNRACWKTGGWNISTDYEYNVPYTGKTRRYKFHITEHDNWVGPDGKIKDKAMLINGSYPGPTVHAEWGDMIEVEVFNELRLNGTSIHWHGIHMRNNAVNDGANGVTECPTAPGKSKKYHFLAEQYGTSWYHSHFGSQYANGVLGAVVIDGPASRNYDIDLGVLQVADWYYGAADTLAYKLGQTVAAPPPSDNVFFNGKAVGPDGKGGAYERMTLTPKKRHRLRLVNPSVDNTFIVSLVNHQFTVISNDLVPVQPAEPVDHVYLSVGQRIDVTIDADQDASSYWFNVTMDSSNLCGTTKAAKPAMIFDYEGAPKDDLPRIAGTPPAATVACADRIDYAPVVRRTAPVDEFEITDHNDLDVMLATGTQTVKWNIHGQSINITWDEPTLEYVAKGVTDFPPEYNLITNPAEHKWSFWLVQNFGIVPHPLHLHGHDFLVLGRSTPPPNLFNMTVDEFNATIAFRTERDLGKLNFENPTRRDVTQLPSWGWVVLAFVTDNPGAWLMHCHIAWHISQGLGVQFLERVDDIPSAVTLGELQPTCRDWEAYWNAVKPEKYDSGL